jgi:hypothetical protein
MQLTPTGDVLLKRHPFKRNVRLKVIIVSNCLFISIPIDRPSKRGEKLMCEPRRSPT